MSCFVLPDSQELRLLPRGTGLCLHLEAVDVGDGDDRGSHIPGEPREGAQGHEDANPEQVQMVARGLLQDSGTGEESGNLILPKATISCSRAPVYYSHLTHPKKSLL